MTPAGLRRVRLVAFTAILAFIALAPAYRQVLGGQNPFVRPWKMYRPVGLGVVDARFSERLSDGSERPIDRFSLFGYESRRDAPLELRRIRGTAGTDAVIRELCDALGPHADVRVRSRLATPDGWRPGYTGEQNRCDPR